MSGYLLPGILGLLLGLLLHWTGFSRTGGVRAALGLRRSLPLRSGLYAVGASMALTAFLCWLAVIDVDTVTVLPLSAGALTGGVLLGIAAGLCGCTPTSAFAALGGARSISTALEALSVLAGCFLMTQLLPSLSGLLAPLRTAPPYAEATLFRVTLDEPFLLDGGFLGQGCAGLLLAAIALCIPSPRPVILTDAEVAARADAPAPEAEAAQAEAPDATPEDDVLHEDDSGFSGAEETPPDAEDAQTEAEDTPPEGAALPPEAGEDESPDEPPVPETAPTGTFVAILPGEEPLVVDTELDEAAPDAADKENKPSAGEDSPEKMPAE